MTEIDSAMSCLSNLGGSNSNSLREARVKRPVTLAKESRQGVTIATASVGGTYGGGRNLTALCIPSGEAGGLRLKATEM